MATQVGQASSLILALEQARAAVTVEQAVVMGAYYASG